LSVAIAHNKNKIIWFHQASMTVHDSQKAKLARGIHSDIGMQETYLVFCSLNSVYG
jgi:hypothetical protein